MPTPSNVRRAVMLVVLMLALIPALPLPGHAGVQDAKALTQEALGAMDAGDPLEAVLKLKAASLALWDDVPLTVTDVRLLQTAGDLAPRSDNVYTQDEDIVMTTRLVGYGLGQEDASYRIELVADFMVQTPDGTVLGGKQEFLRHSQVVPLPVLDFRLDFTYSISGAAPGDYVIRTVVRDLVSGKSTEFSVPVVLQ